MAGVYRDFSDIKREERKTGIRSTHDCLLSTLLHISLLRDFCDGNNAPQSRIIPDSSRKQDE